MKRRSSTWTRECDKRARGRMLKAVPDRGCGCHNHGLLAAPPHDVSSLPARTPRRVPSRSAAWRRAGADVESARGMATDVQPPGAIVPLRRTPSSQTVQVSLPARLRARATAHGAIPLTMGQAGDASCAMRPCFACRAFADAPGRRGAARRLCMGWVGTLVAWAMPPCACSQRFAHATIAGAGSRPARARRDAPWARVAPGAERLEQRLQPTGISAGGEGEVNGVGRTHAAGTP
eukprot:355192-Chlamydomonas_euryale.AAC.5